MKRLALNLAGVACVLLGTAGPAFAQAGSLEERVKSAFVFNFVQFTEWKTEDFPAPDAPLVVGFTGGDSFAGALQAALAGKTCGKHAIQMKRIDQAGDAAACNVLVIAADARDPAGMMTVTRQHHILTIGEGEGFLDQGGVMCMVMEDGKMRFEVNMAAAERAGLQISSRLLKLAKSVRK